MLATTLKGDLKFWRWCPGCAGEGKVTLGCTNIRLKEYKGDEREWDLVRYPRTILNQPRCMPHPSLPLITTLDPGKQYGTR